MPSLKKVKLHLGCGTVYLKGYINIDSNSTLDKKDKKANETTIKKYYKRKFTRTIVKRSIYADLVLDVTDISSYFGNNIVDEIVAVQVFEHFPKECAIEALRDWFKVLKPGGKIYIDVPDILTTISHASDIVQDYVHKLGIDKNIEETLAFYLRLIFGSGKNKYYIHYDGYYPEKLKKMMESVGFKDILFMDLIKHQYPTFGILASK